MKEFQKKAPQLLSSMHESQSFSAKLLNIQENVRKAITYKQGPVDITEIRKALKSYNSTIFEIKQEADSMEAFQAIMDLLHKDHPNEFEVDCECLSHSIFGLLTTVTYSCSCGSQAVYQEELFSQHIITKSLFKATDIRAKIDFTLGIYSEQELIQKSNLFKLQPFPQLLSKVIKKKRKEKRCEICNLEYSDAVIRLRRIPKVFTVQLVWDQRNPSREKNLNLLKNISQNLNLQELELTEVPTCHVLKGMIVRLTNHYIYIVRSDKQKWVIINDSFAKDFYWGDYYTLPHFFLDYSAYPVGLFYEESEEMLTGQDIDASIALQYEKKLNFFEILDTKNIDYSEFSWICFYCESTNQDNASVHCFVCNSVRIFQLENWNCEVCGFFNNLDTITCDNCINLRFWKPDLPVDGKESRVFKVLKEFCALCTRNISNGMTLICINCNSKVIGLRCECDYLDSEFVCLFCLEKFTKCLNCKKNILKTDPICRHCGKVNENCKPCEICTRLGTGGKCDDCRNIGNVICAICKEHVEVAVCYICPICDSEIFDSYCSLCDYDVCYDRFVCGKCRKRALRCFACEAGLILQGDSRCHLCRTKRLAN